jgi:PDDEXK-like uncharacterized protein DUF3799
MRTGIHAISADAYHADPAETPSLSASIARILCSSSPAHARAAHPRLNPEYEREEADKFDLGTAAHALLLQGEQIVHVVDAPDWKKQDARNERNAARLAGKVPMLPDQWERVQAMVAATAARLAALDTAPPPFTDGKPEQTLIWEENGVVCRALVDWLRDDHAVVDDYKTTSKSASPEQWPRTLFSTGCDVQAAFYLRGLKALTNVDAEFRFIVQETFPPYALAVFSLGPDALALAEARVRYALAKWRDCLDHDEWPAYPTEVCHVEMPGWEEAKWLEREAREAA